MSGSPSPDGRDAEIAIDLGDVDGFADPDEPSPPASRRAWPGLPPGRENLLLAYAAIAIALIAATVTAVKLSPLNRPLAEETVTAYLEAVRDGDVDEALSRTNVADPVDTLLRPEALDDSWRIVTVAQVDYTERQDRSAIALVYAEIEAEDGTRAGFRYRVKTQGGRAVIENALVAVETFAVFDHLDVNGVSVPVQDDTGLVELMLLPGVYRFYPDLPSTLAFADASGVLALGSGFTVLGDDYTDSWLYIPMLELSEEGEAAVDATMRAHFDACAADPSLDACPFGFPEDPDREVVFAPGATWEIAAYPVVHAQWWWYELGEGFGMATGTPGEALAEVTITEDGRERAATVSCPIWTEGLLAVPDFEGGFTIEQGTESPEERCRSLIEVG